ncbi:MAG: ribonuclease R [Bacilli bacterium]|nr:ribonuclease R [Bacilli bacterium]
MKDKIINILDNSDKPAKSAIEINDELGFTDIEDYRQLEKELTDMAKEGILYYSEKKKRYLLLKNSHLIKGKLIMNPKGYGFVEIGDDKKDIYINKDNLNNARNNDIVLIELIGDKTEGRINKILARDEDTFVGTVYFKDDKCFVKPDKRNSIDIEVTKESQHGLVEGHKVLIKPISGHKYLGEVLTIIGHKNDVGVDILSFVYENNFHPDFPEDVIEQLKEIPDTVSEKEMENRLDLRDITIFTIDGDDTKDIDDAISIKKIDDKTYELGVHIADVSNYVLKDSPLDKEAYERGTSVYLVDRVIPMIPHQLSNGICSLNPNVDRLAMSCIMQINNHGEVVHYDIKPSVIKSRIQMTYNKVNDILDKNIIANGYENYVDDLKLMSELSDILRNKMIKRGYIEFSSSEPKIIVDDNCHPLEVKVREEGTGENMIENFMVVANETVASFIFYQSLPGIYRVHDKPDEKRLQKFFDFLSIRGYVVNGKRQNVTGKDLQFILNQLTDKPDFKILNDMAIRCQAKAVYSSENIGHYGLGSKCYSHFTSPIRRYPDLILHRLVKDYSYNYSNEVISNWEKNLPELANHCSIKEQDSIKCERDVDDMKMAEYMEDHIGEEFEGIISNVQEFGMFVELPNSIEGLVKIEDMPGGGYRYIEEKLSLINKNTRLTFTFGDKVKVKCIRANKEESTIDFELIKKIDE